MKYINAAEILSEQLLKELQTYIDGSMLYVPKASAKKEWGAASGARTFYQERNKKSENWDMQFDFDCVLDYPLPKGFHFVNPDEYDMDKGSKCCWKAGKNSVKSVTACMKSRKM